MAEYRISIPKLKIRRWDWLLVIGLILSPMTGLRFWKIGPSEALVLLWCLKYIPRNRIRNSDVAIFFGLFLGSMALGTMWGLFFARDELSLSGWTTWIYLGFIAIGLCEGLRRNTIEYNEHLMYCFTSLSAVVHFLLYLYAMLGGRTFFGAPLWYYYRYSGGGTNPHQIAIMMCALVFLLAREILSHRRVVWNLILMICCTVVLLETESATGLMALAVGMLIDIMLVINRPAKKRGQRIRLIILESIVALLLLVVFYNLITRYAYEWIASDSNGLGRLQIFSNIKKTFVKGPLFGLGPGVHSRNESGNLIEYHNTYLEVLAASGLVGVFALIQFTVRLLKKISADNTLLPIVVALYTYGFAGFGMRRLVYWGIVVFVYSICSQKTAENVLQQSVPQPGAVSVGSRFIIS